MQETILVILPIKNKRKQIRVNLDELKFNKDVAADRLLAETFFARMHTLWNIMKKCYRWSECDYDMYMSIFVSLTNYHVILHPLRNDDGNRYR